MTDRPVPLCDIHAQYRQLQPEIDAAVLRVVASGHAINGPDVAAFEQEAAAYCGVAHAVGCANGTDAISLALAALDIGPGDEVILPPFTFFATVGSVLRIGATPVFADVRPDTFNIDPAEAAKKVTGKTKAIMPVHLFGQCADMDPLLELAARHRLHVIEDAAQAYGATYNGRKAGSMGAVNCFSFYPSKNLGTLGDAGMVTTNDPGLAKKLFALRNHGCEVKYYHKHLGWNARLDTVQAAILRAKVPHVDAWLDGRRAAADRYDRLFAEYGLTGYLTPPTRDGHGGHTFNQYVVRAAGGRRDALVQHLKANQIGCEVYYPLPLHLQECVKPLGYAAGDFPVSERAAEEVFALPMFPEITEAQQRRALGACASFGWAGVRQAA